MGPPLERLHGCGLSSLTLEALGDCCTVDEVVETAATAEMPAIDEVDVTEMPFDHLDVVEVVGPARSQRELMTDSPVMKMSRQALVEGANACQSQ